MQQFDRSKSLEELEGEDWGEPEFLSDTQKFPQLLQKTHGGGLELVLEGIRCGSGWVSLNPIGLDVAVFDQQRITAEQAGDQRDRRDHDKENQPKHDGADDLAKQHSESKPESIKW